MKPLFRLSALSVALANLFLGTVALAQPSLYEIRQPVPGLVVAPLSLAPLLEQSTNSIDFGSVLLGQSSQAQVLLTNTGNAPLLFAQPPQLSGAAFSSTTSCAASLAPASSCLVQVRFTPLQVGTLSGTLSIVSNDANSPAGVSLSGVGLGSSGDLTGTTSFGVVAVGSSTSRTFTFTNNGTAAASGVSASVQGSGFALGANTCGTATSPATVQPGASCTVSVTFAPTVGGEASAQLSVASTAVNSPSVLTLRGTAASALGQLLADTSASFGSVFVNGDATRTFAFTNLGTLSATNVYTTLTGAGLALVANTCGTSGARVTVAAGQSCSITVKYTPTVAGPLTGQLSVVSSAPNSPSSVALTATAEAGFVQSFPYSGAIKYLTVQSDGDYTFRVAAAQGGSSISRSGKGGKGAQATCTVTLASGTVVKLLAGQQGVNGSNFGGGGGGSYVTLADNTPLCIAGGGGGSLGNISGNAGRAIVASATGVGGALTGVGINRSGAGGGLTTDGASAPYLGGGKAFVNGAVGGSELANTATGGGYAAGGLGGGGAGGMGNWNGGGGGGYNGGDGGDGSPGTPGQGGTSFVYGTNTEALAGVQSGNGEVTVFSHNSSYFVEQVAQTSLSATAGADFGTVPTNTTTSRSFTYSNTGSIPVSGVYAAVTGTGLSLSSNSCGTLASPVNLAAGQTCSMTVAYTPTTAGALASASLSVTSSGATAKSQALAGSAIAPVPVGSMYLAPAVNSSSYVLAASGSNATRNIALYNTSGQSMGGFGVPSLTGSAFYTITSNGCTATVANGASCVIAVRYAPTAADTSSAQLSINVPGVGAVSASVYGSTSETLVFGKVTEGNSITLTAPNGKTLGEVVFASYGTPAGSTGATYVAGSCHAKNSVTAATTAFTGKTTGSISAHNNVFGDPCNGTSKSLAVAVRVY